MSRNFSLQEKLFFHFWYCFNTGNLFWLRAGSGRKAFRPVGTIRKNITHGHHREAAYRYVFFEGRSYPVHRLIWVMNFGDIPDNMQIDHIDGDGLNNRIQNLRLVTAQDQARNHARPMNNTSGIMGVRQSSDSRYWDAYVGRKRIGTFGSRREAAERAESARLAQGYHQNHGRD